MDTRPLPQTDLRVSTLCFGNFVFGTNWWGDFSDEDALSLQRYAVDRGVTFFDTAPAYGNGRAETLLGKTIAEVGRDRLVISTKFGYDFYSDPGEEGSHRERRQDFSSSFVREDIERSLQRLGTDRIDLYQAHNLKLPQMSDELYDTLDTLREEGKLRAWGVALGPAIGWREEGVAAFEHSHCATVQTVMNVYEQDPGREFCELAAEHDRGIIARVPTNSGILDEEFASDEHTFPPHDHRKFRDKAWLTYGLKKNAILKPIAADLGLSLRQFAFRWLMSQEGMLCVQPNLLSEADIDDYAAVATDELLPADVPAQVDELYSNDFGLGDEAHPCDLKSSVAEGGRTRSHYQGAAGVMVTDGMGIDY